MAKFKCVVSGNVVEFTNQVDIDSMVGHEGYVKLDETPAKETAPVVKKVAPTAKATKEAE